MPQEIVFPEPRSVMLQNADLPPMGPGQVRLRSRVTLLSTGTEGTVFSGRYAAGTHWDRWFGFPHRPGYSCVADVEDAGDTALPVGTRVAAQLGHASHHVVDIDRCTLIPDTVSDDEAVWFALAKVAYVGAEASGAGLGSRTLVIGGGPVGQMSSRWLLAAGAETVTVVDRSSSMRLELAATGGATATVQAEVASLRDDIEPPNVVVDSTGNPDAFTHALELVADHGRVVLVGDAGDPNQQRLTSDLIIRGITVVGAHGNHVRGKRDQDVRRRFFDLVARRRFVLDGLITHRFDPSKCAEAYALTETARHSSLGIVFDWIDR